MREIKFRAWDKKSDIMRDWDYIRINWGMHALTPAYSDVTEIMQFTGLHDCHGNEIYEGDVVRVYHKPSNNPEHPEWDNIEAFRFTVDDIRNVFDRVGMTEKEFAQREVIGNIYEHELVDN